MDVVTLALAKNYTNKRIAEVASAFVYKGAVNYRADLDNIAAEIGHIYTVKYKGTSGEIPWNTEFVYGKYEGDLTWIELGPSYDTDIANLKQKIETEEVTRESGDNALSSRITTIETAYLKNASVSGFTLTLTKQDDTAVSIMGSDFTVAEERIIEDE